MQLRKISSALPKYKPNAQNPFHKERELLTTVCNEEQRLQWEKTTDLVKENHTMITEELPRARKLRTAITTAIKEEKAKINSIKHIDEFMLRKIRSFQRYYSKNKIVNNDSTDKKEYKENDVSYNVSDEETDREALNYKYFNTTRKHKYKKNLKFGIEEIDKNAKKEKDFLAKIEGKSNKPSLMKRREKRAQTVRKISNQNKA